MSNEINKFRHIQKNGIDSESLRLRRSGEGGKESVEGVRGSSNKEDNEARVIKRITRKRKRGKNKR